LFFERQKATKATKFQKKKVFSTSRCCKKFSFSEAFSNEIVLKAKLTQLVK